ncbi:cytoplasmic protein [Azospirillum sp. TSH100]|uniref:winged helix-turn-helix domain-containing protein n=1 Tax=Azospirillum sp. TSH100 TaxID=652764 RepID=UPI000D60F2DB|nr:crosslink repair DNA glycosylase YcaQ family protein [Azospirillum sp. TSH100]PWC90312.1 cytoplasmic protein [Azospirillum sp. TSH100]QCG91417.1 winged helix-turn-helix domain-containing protein [Azospirillum sp. TSH100]
MPRPDSLSLREARRVAIAAQGFPNSAPNGAPNVAAGATPDADPVEARHARRLIGRLGLVQIDSVNVLVRSHYLPLFSRLGPYEAALLDRLAYGGKRRALFEYWGHEASLIPVEQQPLFRWRMARAERGEGTYGELARFAAERRPYIDAVLAEVAARGPMGASELSEAGRGAGGWWGWSDGKRALEHLFWAGLVTTAGRRGFERLYDLPERVLPAAILDAPTPEEAEAQRALLRIAARAHGVATERDLRDYHRLDLADARLRIAELVEAGELLPVTVEGWDRTAYVTPDLRIPRKAPARALLSPFDSLIWERQRTERLFGARIRLEIYTPAHKREHGYYVLPFLMDERIAARVDLKSDRKAATLLVQAAHAEPHASVDAVAPPLAVELRRLAGWLGLERVTVAGAGDLAPALAGALRLDGV